MPRSRVSLSAAVLAATLSLGGASAAAAKSYSPMDEQWLTAAIAGDRFEIAGGALAQAQGTTATVRRLGAMLARDHTRSLHADVRLARRLGIDPPKAPTPSEQWELHTLANTDGGLFDHRYITLEVQDHHQDIREVKPEIHEGQNGRVVAQARQDLKVYKKHLAMLEAARPTS
jgi:putative membrane protein